MTKPNVRALGIVPRYVLQLSFAGVIPACAADVGDVSSTVADPSNSVSAGQPSPSVIVLATSGFSNQPPQNTVPSTSQSSRIIVLAICGFCGSNGPPQPSVPSAASSDADAGSDLPGSVDGGYLGDGGELVDGSVATDASAPDDVGTVSTGPELIVLAIQGFANSGNDAG